MAQFEVGKSYGWVECGLDPLTVLSRSAKMITVTNGQNTWRMRIRNDERGEYVIDSSVPKDSRLMYTSRAIWEDKTWKPIICY